MNDFDGKLVDKLVENAPSPEGMGISESNVGGASEKPKVYDEQNPPPLEDETAVLRHERALADNARENDVRFEQGLEAMRKSIQGVSGATLEITKEYNSKAGKEVPVVNTYTPDSSTQPQVPQKAEEGK
jgi:hypothetical protein